MAFNTLGISPALVIKLKNQRIISPSPIQAKAIPSIFDNKDVLGIAPTGSGKTASYALPILTKLEGNTTNNKRLINTLILVPTRELAIQVAEVFQLFGSVLSPEVRAKAVYGGVAINPQMKSLAGIQVLIATPGRLLELFENKAVLFTELKTLVLDEADKLLNLGFKEEMNKIIGLLPKERQNLLFSATLSPAIEEIHQVLLHEPVVIHIETKKENLDLINQQVYFVSEESKGPILRYIIKSKNLKQVLVFASSTRKADNLAGKLRKNKIDAIAIHGKKSQAARNEALQKFKAGKVRVLVTTDLLSRGIDIEFLPCVINYELPRSPKDFVHRIGRTGRAKNSGLAISIVSANEEHHFKVIQKKMNRWAEVVNVENIDLQGM